MKALSGYSSATPTRPSPFSEFRVTSSPVRSRERRRRFNINGQHSHPLYQWLTQTPDADGAAGEVEWNFEKFLISPGGEIVARFRPTVAPEDETITNAIEAVIG